MGFIGVKMKFENIKLTIDNDIAVVVLNRPKKYNALSKELFLELDQALEFLQTQKLKGMVLTGEGGKAFAGGADIAQMAKMNQQEGIDFSALAQNITLKIEKLPFVVIAAVDGFALGGGCELAMACDFIFASESAKFGQPEVSLGLIPGFGGCIRLPLYVGASRARELIYSGRTIDAQTAKEYGLVLEVFKTRAELLIAAREKINEIGHRSKSAVTICKKVIQNTMGQNVADGLIQERDAFGEVFLTADKVEGVAAFVEKRSAQFH